MSVLTGAVNMGRKQAESRFTETLEAYTVEKVLVESGPDAGTYVDTPTNLYTDVAGRVKFPTLTVMEREQGGQVPAVQDVTVHVAVGATPDVVVGVFWRVTASKADVSLVGRVFRTKGVPQAGQVTAHRYPVESVA